MTLTRARTYWRPDAAALTPRVEFTVVGDAARRLEALRSGQVDGTYAVPPAAAVGPAAAGVPSVSSGRATTTTSLVITNRTGPLQEAGLRRALSLSVDRGALARDFAGPQGRPARAPSATGQWAATEEEQQRWFRNLPSADYNRDEALRLVASAGVPARPLVVAVGDDAQQALAERIQGDCVVTGLPVTVTRLPARDYATYLEDHTAYPDVDAHLLTVSTDVADPVEVYTRFASTVARRSFGFGDASFDEVLTRAVAESDPARRLVLADILQRIVMQDVAWVPLYESPSLVAQRPGVTGAPVGFFVRWIPWAGLVGRV